MSTSPSPADETAAATDGSNLSARLRNMLTDDDWRRLALCAKDVVAATHIHRKWDANLYRLQLADGRRTVLKVFAEQASGARPTELLAYELLAELDVPTVPARISGRAVLMEDLASSRHLRLANEEDMQREATGLALAAWYRDLHAAGDRFVAAGDARRSLLPREDEMVTEQSVAALAARALPAPAAGWEWVAERTVVIVEATRRMRTTFNYNDFNWSNLALGRDDARPDARMFDFHIFGLGMAYCDVRNVAGGLHEPARSAFLEAYGPVPEEETTLDGPISLLTGLLLAQRRSKPPKWMTPLLDDVRTGRFEDSLRAALDVANQVLAR